MALRMPISRVRSVTETSMMFMITMPPTTSEMAAMAIMAMKKVPLRFAQMLRKLSLVSDCKAVGLAGQVVAAGAQDHAGLVHGRLQLGAGCRWLCPKCVMLLCAPYCFRYDGDGHQGVVVAALAERLALLLADADHVVDSPSTRISLPMGSGPGNRLSTTSVPITATLERLFSSFSLSMRPDGQIKIRIGAMEGVKPRIQTSLIDCSPYLTCPSP